MGAELASTHLPSKMKRLLRLPFYIPVLFHLSTPGYKPIINMSNHKHTPLFQASSLKAVLFLAAIWSLVLFFYSLGWSGDWHFDDAPNLNNLLAVFGNGQIDLSAAQDFVFSGTAGPLGRPISLASFLIDGSTWPASPRALLYTNSLLHGLNALLFCGLWLAVLRQRGQDSTQASWIAVSASLLWLLQPILASGVLMAVQRMTLLSSSFMLLGAWLYVLGRQHLETRPIKGWTLMLSGLGGGTLLGVFSKEQAALLPLLLWVLDACLLRQPHLNNTHQKLWHLFKLLAFYLPAAVIALYLLRIVLNADAAYANRDFNLNERLWTQSIILWDYLRLGLFPRTLAFGPYHDDYPILGASLTTILAATAWLLLFVVFWLLRHKSRWPLFALLWFWVSHLVESTVVPLELYFEHRNYLAIAGPLLALTALTTQWAQNDKARQRIIIGMLSIYGLLLAGILWQVTSLFGQNAVASQLWHQQHPHSTRAAQYLAGSLSDRGDVAGALAVLDDTASHHPDVAGGLNLQGLLLACTLNTAQDELQDRLNKVLTQLPLVTKQFDINDPLDKLKTILNKDSCNDFLSHDMLVQIAKKALGNANLSRIPTFRSNVHYFLGTLYIDARDLGNTMQHLEAAMQAVPQLQTMQLMVKVLLSANLKQEALELMDEYTPSSRSKSFWLRKKQQQQWQQLREQLES